MIRLFQRGGVLVAALAGAAVAWSATIVQPVPDAVGTTVTGGAKGDKTGGCLDSDTRCTDVDSCQETFHACGSDDKTPDDGDTCDAEKNSNGVAVPDACSGATCNGTRTNKTCGGAEREDLR